MVRRQAQYGRCSGTVVEVFVVQLILVEPVVAMNCCMISYD
jgi:hypothetical protein